MIQHRSVRVLASVLAGALFTLALSPFDLWPLALISPAALLYLWQRAPASAVSLGIGYGIGFFGAGASWVYVSIHVYGQASPPLAALLTALFCGGLGLLFGIQGWCWQRLTRQGRWAPLLTFPPLWVLFEWLRSWLLTGFPWLYAGYAALDTPLAGWAPVVGVYGASLLLVALAAGLTASLAQPRRSRRWGYWGLAVVLAAALGLGFSRVPFTEPSAAPIPVALYQPNLALQDKWDPRQFRRILTGFDNNLATVTATGAGGLLLWPESAIPAYRHQIEPWLDQVEQQLAASQMGLITGLPIRTPDARHNSLIGLGRSGGVHHKQKLVPFGEYVPLDAWLRGLIAFFDLPMSQFNPGPRVAPQLTFDDLPIGVFICYEIVYPDFVARQVGDTAFLITVSNDSWFGESIGPWQHLQMARFRALEAGRDLLRGTNNGVTAIIDHRGQVVASLPQFVAGTLAGDITPRRGATLFSETGSWPVLLLCTLLLAMPVSAARRR